MSTPQPARWFGTWYNRVNTGTGQLPLFVPTRKVIDMGNDTKKTIMFNGTECAIMAGPYPANKLALCVYLNEVDTGETYAVL